MTEKSPKHRQSLFSKLAADRQMGSSSNNSLLSSEQLQLSDPCIQEVEDSDSDNAMENVSSAIDQNKILAAAVAAA